MTPLRLFSIRVTAAIATATLTGVSNGERGRILFHAFLATATLEKGASLTIGDVTRLCAMETQKAVELGLVK